MTYGHKLTLILVNSMGELIDSGRDLESGHENSLLSLNTNVLGPFHKTSEVSLRLDVTPNSIVTRILLKQRTLFTFRT